MINSTEFDTVLSLVPNALFHTDENGIVWHKDNTQPQPTQSEIDTELARLQAEQPKQAKRDEINLACEQAILGGFISNALGTLHTYSSSRDDQLNLIGLVSANVPSMFKCVDSNGVSSMVQHTAVELVQVLQDGAVFKSEQLSKARNLKDLIGTSEDLSTIIWI